ncbi:hypothetical protein DINM_003460 [Dirofilaria immitis]|nr:hypothetical protein [Dirofilaria immitis]
MIDFPSFHARSMSFVAIDHIELQYSTTTNQFSSLLYCETSPISIIITLCLGSIQCFQSVQDGESLKDEYDQWLLWSRIGDGCKGDENAWIKPAFIGYLVGQLLGGIFGVALYIKLLHCELDLLISNRGLIKNDWVIENEDENCDAVEKAPWSLYFFRGMIFGFLIGLSGGILSYPDRLASIYRIIFPTLYYRNALSNDILRRTRIKTSA